MLKVNSTMVIKSGVCQISIRKKMHLFRSFFTACWVILFSFSTLLPSVVYAKDSEAPELFTLLAERSQPLNPTQTHFLDQIRQRPTTASVTLAKANVNALSGPNTRITLSNTETFSFNRSRVEKGAKDATDFTWFGTLTSGDFGTATLVIHDGSVMGTIRTINSLYSIEPIGDGIQAIIQINESRFPPDEPPSGPLPSTSKEKQGNATNSSSVAVSPHATKSKDSPIRIDVLVAYTPAVHAAVSDLPALIQLAIAEANQSYQNSKINISLNLVDNFELPYSETDANGKKKSYNKILADFTSMADVENRRISKGADIAVLLVDQTDYCGMAYLQADTSQAFAIVYYDCATGYYSFAHELGHILGADHDPDNKPTTSTPYAHGLQHHSPSPSWRTIMAYANGCPAPCPRLQYWSNPDISFSGVPMGTAETHNNSRILNERASTVAGFKARPHSNIGSIWQYTGAPCNGQFCLGWQMLDDNAATVRIAAGANNLYQLHRSGKIWRYTGIPCNGISCPGWQMLDHNSATIGIVAGGNQLYQLHKDGQIWQYTGRPCSGNNCPGWQLLDRNPATLTIAADNKGPLYQLHKNGEIWHYTGTPCNRDSCPGWEKLDNREATVRIVAGGNNLYQLLKSGEIWHYTGTPCRGNYCPGWQMLDNNPATLGIVASGLGGAQLFQLHNNSTVWRYTGRPCSGSNCPGWQMLDNKPASSVIATSQGGGGVYQIRNNGTVLQYRGMPCDGNNCPEWLMLDNTSNTGRIAISDNKLYQLHTAHAPMTRERTCYECK